MQEVQRVHEGEGRWAVSQKRIMMQARVSADWSRTVSQ